MVFYIVLLLEGEGGDKGESDSSVQNVQNSKIYNVKTQTAEM